MRALEHQEDRGHAVRLIQPPPAREWGQRLAVDRYSRRVALLKRVLPAIGVALLLLVVAWPRLSPLLDSVRLGFGAIDLREARELKMLNPRYSGIDRFNRPYVVTAAIGRQVPNRNDLMSLEQPRAELTAHGGAKIVVTATTGIYQSQAELLDLFGKVTLTHQNGTRFVTRRAHADFLDNTAEGHDPIEGHGPSGDVWGQGFRVFDKGDTIIFTGRSRLVLKGAKPGKPTTSPPALPAGVAMTAARVEAAAAPSSTAQSSALVAVPARAEERRTRPLTAHRAAAKPPSPGSQHSKRHIARKPVERPAPAGKIERDAG